jgi:tetratricopeptide (TPR) repeat protein
MRKGLIVLCFALLSGNLYAPPNCEVYKNDEYCYLSCQEAMTAIRYMQGSYQSQVHFDKSIEICSSFAYSYMEKAVPFLKRGLFIEWKKLIDKAVDLEPEEYLGYRGWCRLQFLRDYEGAISDIEELKSLVNYDIGYCQTGDYHLNVALALCYKEIGDYAKAKSLFIEHMKSESYSEDLYDYYHLGVLEYELGNFEKAIKCFDKQIEINDYLGETYYFKGMAYKALNQSALYTQCLDKAEEYYRKGNLRRDNYTETIDKIYLLDILEEKERLNTED